MPRPPRFLLSQSYYHVMTRGNNKNIVFKDKSDYSKYLDLVKELKGKHHFDLYHYCLMPNHTHFLIHTKNKNDFSIFMKRLNLKYFYYYKRKYGWVGHFWQDRYKSQAVGKDEYFIQCGKYIELNPVRGKIVQSPDDYLFSSSKYYSLGKKDELITADMFYSELGNTSEERQHIYQKILIDEAVIKTYKEKEWGSKEQRYNEHRKKRYNMIKKLSL